MAEQTFQGRGAVQVYQLITRLLRIKQPKDGYNKYAREFTDIVSDLEAQGTAQEIIDKMFNALFILGLDQDQFRDQLSHVYGADAWPEWKDYKTSLRSYAEHKRNLSTLIVKDNNDSKISANRAEVNRRNILKRAEVDVDSNESKSSRQCFNCGSTKHFRRDCPNTPVRCSICQRSHLERFCPRTGRNEVTDNERDDESVGTFKSGGCGLR